VAPPDRAAPETDYGGYAGRGIAAPRSNLGEIGEASRANSTCRLEAVISRAEMKIYIYQKINLDKWRNHASGTSEIQQAARGEEREKLTHIWSPEFTNGKDSRNSVKQNGTYPV
jgi:hypothetical protein